MSWQQYVDSNLVGTKKVTKAAIHGLDGSVWATSKGFNVKPVTLFFNPLGFHCRSSKLGQGIP
jgi:hypothetical protein